MEIGLRINEALNIKYNDIDFDNQYNVFFLRIRKEISKNGKERSIPISVDALEQIELQKLKFFNGDFNNLSFIFLKSKGEHYKYKPNGALKNVFKKAGIENLKNVGFHIFRHTFASHRLQGVNYKGEKIEPVRMKL